MKPEQKHRRKGKVEMDLILDKADRHSMVEGSSRYSIQAPARLSTTLMSR